MFNTIILILIIIFISKIYISNKLNTILKKMNDKINKLDEDVQESFVKNESKETKKKEIELPEIPIQKKKKKIDLTPKSNFKTFNKYKPFNEDSNCYNYLNLQ